MAAYEAHLLLSPTPTLLALSVSENVSPHPNERTLVPIFPLGRQKACGHRIGSLSVSLSGNKGQFRRPYRDLVSQ